MAQVQASGAQKLNLRDQLVADKKTRWLDIGNGGEFAKGFYYLDTFPENMVAGPYRSRYFRLDIASAGPEALQSLGQFDLIRMQHVFEHLTLEEGARTLENCARLLLPGGVLLMSVPDLRVNIQKYLEDGYKDWKGFQGWAHQRIPTDAPNSFYFSIFAHSMTYESHKWCYDYEGLEYQVAHTEKFTDIHELKPDDEQANVPFTHNRPDEDVCLVARRK
jgi:predicted SAM-dependent methyltransferase